MKILLNNLDLNNTYFINFTCDSKVLIEREEKRKNRPINLAIDQKQQIKELNFEYDLIFDTTDFNPKDFRIAVNDLINNKKPIVLKNMAKKLL